MSQRDDEVKDLKEKVESLTRLVGVLSSAFDKMNKSQSIISHTVDNLVETLETHNNELSEIKGGVSEILRRLPSPKNKRGTKP